MTDYDFKTLNDKEFEVFCSDLIGAYKTVHIERFKAGRDGGIDGRYFISNNKEIILQCKHWANTPITQLINHLAKIEKPKLDNLKPSGYLLAVSNKLSHADKKAISLALGGHIKSESDIFGNEDLNDLIPKYPDIEKRHYKLWLCSTGVLSHIINKPIFERSIYSLKEALAVTQKYVVTSNHDKAISKLEALGVVILSGEPGVGKTTLAEHICLQYVNDGYEFIKIEDDINEAEAVLKESKKQIFYFDDFLGRNYFEALQGKTGSRVVSFIRRIASEKNCKRFILTSRSTVLNQGKVLMDCFKHQNLDQNEFELTVATLSEMDKARILYNHLWYTNLPHEYIDELYKDKRYRKIISHKNFNPRLINFITDYTRHENLDAKDYWEKTIDSLNNPADVWENPFVAQQDDYSRALVLLVTLNRSAISEDALAVAYNLYLGYPENAGLQGRRDFLTNLKHLTGSLLTKYITENEARFDLFNPSLGDYVLNRYTRDIPSLKLAMLSIRSVSSYQTLVNLYANNMLKIDSFMSVLESILTAASNVKYTGYDPLYISKVVLKYVKGEKYSQNIKIVTDSVAFVMNEALQSDYEDVINLANWAIKNDVAKIDIYKLVKSACEIGVDHSSLLALVESFYSLDIKDPQNQKLKEHYDELVLDYIAEIIADEVYEGNLFDDVAYDDDGHAQDNVERHIEILFDLYGATCSKNKVSQVLKHFDVSNELMEYHHRNAESYDDVSKHSNYVQAADGIDDLFDRG